MANSDLLTMCVNLTNSVLEAKKTAYISIRIGNEFNFTFNNQERNPFTWTKKKSPSQARRDEERLNQFQKKKAEEGKGVSIEEAQLEDSKKDERNEKTVAYELQFDAPNCTEDEIEECFDFNFKDELKGMDLDKDDTAYSFKKKDARLVLKKVGQNYESMKTFIVKINDNEQVKKAMEVFADNVNFDPACFKGAIRNEKLANLREFKKLQTKLFKWFFLPALGFLPTKYCIYYLICEP